MNFGKNLKRFRRGARPPQRPGRVSLGAPVRGRVPPGGVILPMAPSILPRPRRG